MRHGRVVEGGIAEIDVAQGRAEEDEGGAGDLLGAHLLADVRQRALDERLIRPADAVGDDDRAIRAVEGRQGALDHQEVADRQMDGERRPRPAQRLQVLARRHGAGLPGGAGEDDGLRDLRNGQLAPQRGGGGGIGADAGRHVVGDARRFQSPDLFRDGPVEGRVAGMHARHVLAPPVRRLDLGHDLVQRQRRGIDHPPRRLGHDGLRHEAARVEADGARADEAQALDGDEVGVAGAGADEMDGHGSLPSDSDAGRHRRA